MRLGTICFDAMHTLDGGVTAHAVANVLFDLTYEQAKTPMARKEKWLEVRGKIQDIMRQQGSSRMSFHHFNMRSFVHDLKAPRAHYPHLSGLKCAEMKALVPAVTKLLEDLSSTTDDPEETHRKLMMRHLNEFYSILDSSGLFLKPSQHVSAVTAMTSFLQHYTFLSKVAMRNGLLKYSLVPKFHAAMHIAMNSSYCNPRWTHCYSAENFVSTVIRLSNSSMDGTNTWLVPAKVIKKYSVHFELLQQVRCID
jgi:hypothetical protein